MRVANLFASLPSAASGEVLDVLSDAVGVKIERIVTRGQSTPEGQWYDQETREWVCLLRGAARIRFADGELVELGPGDWLDIAAHCRHRVEWATPEELTVWLAVHFGG